MPVKGFLCPPGYTFNGKKTHTFKECLDECTNKCMPRQLLVAIVKSLEQDYHTGNYISVTALNGCLRQTYLERKVDYHIRPVDRAWAPVRGSLIHGMLESQDKRRYIIENKYYIEINGIRIHGTVDSFDRKTKTITDYKTMKDGGLPMIMRNGPKKEHILQANAYKIFLEKGVSLDKRYKRKYKAEHLEIVYIGMSDVVQTGSKKAVVDKGSLKFYTVPDVPILPEREVLDHIEKNSKVLNNAFEYNKVPPPPDIGTQAWLCGFNMPRMDGYCTMKFKCSHWINKATKEGIII